MKVLLIHLLLTGKLLVKDYGEQQKLHNTELPVL